MYKTFTIPKRDGGERIIEAPNNEVKNYLTRVLNQLERIYNVSPFAHGFVKDRNIATMALPHVGKKYVLSMDFENFFPSITVSKFMDREKKARKIHFKNSTKEVIMHYIHDCFYDFNDGQGLRLPQGSPTSPFLSNIYMTDFDWKMAWFCFKFSCDYSRYADDIVISGNKFGNIMKCKEHAQSLVGEFKLKFNNKKTKIMKNTSRQVVCGLVVNKKININRKYKKNLRAEIHNQTKTGTNISEQTKGKIAFTEMIFKNKRESFSSSDIIYSIVAAKKLKKMLLGKDPL